MTEPLERGALGTKLVRWGMFGGSDLATIVNWLSQLFAGVDLQRAEVEPLGPVRARAFLRRAEGKLWRLTVTVGPEPPHDLAEVLCEPARDGHETRRWDDVASLPAPRIVDSSLSSDLQARIDDRLSRLRLDDRLVGVAAVIASREGALYLGGFGFADLEREIPITTDTVFRIGSVSKTMTALAAMQLWEKGRFRLDDAVNDHLRAYRIEAPDPEWPPVTVWHLLTHSSGIELVQRRDSFWWLDDTRPIPPLAEWYRSCLRLDKPPGSERLYNNNGYATLGQMIEDVSGQRFESYMVDKVFEPLGMSHSDYVPSQRVTQRRAVSYQFASGDIDSVEGVDVVFRPAGAAMVSLGDMGRYLVALLRGGSNDHGCVVESSTLDRMLTPQAEEGELQRQGLGFFVRDADGRRWAWHTGGWAEGQTSVLLFVPSEGLGVAILANTRDIDTPGERHMDVATEILDKLIV